MTEDAYYFAKIIEEDQAQKRRGFRSAFDGPEDNVLEKSSQCPDQEGEADEH